jgi:hypothetical protein
MVQAILTTNNAYDTVILADGTAMEVTAQVFEDLTSDALDINNWSGTGDWSEHGEDVATAAQAYGDVVAQVIDGQLVVVDADKFAERKAFYGV